MEHRHRYSLISLQHTSALRFHLQGVYTSFKFYIFTCFVVSVMGRVSSVGIATRYGLESWWDEIFRICPDRT